MCRSLKNVIITLILTNIKYSGTQYSLLINSIVIIINSIIRTIFDYLFFIVHMNIDLARRQSVISSSYAKLLRSLGGNSIDVDELQKTYSSTDFASEGS